MPESTHEPTDGATPSGPDAGPGPRPTTGHDPDEARGRLRGALAHPSRRQWVVAVLLAALGFAVVAQVGAQRQDDRYSALRTEDLISILSGLNAAGERADNDLGRLQRSIEQLRSSTDRRRAALGAQRAEASALSILAGTAPAVGPGVTITVTDPTGAVGVNEILNGIEELRDAGAEAMQVGGSGAPPVRFVASSWVEEAPEGIEVDGTRMRPPYRIEAVGDARTLASALDFYGGFIDGVRGHGGTVEVQREQRLRVDATVPGPSGLVSPGEGQ